MKKQLIFFTIIGSLLSTMPIQSMEQERPIVQQRTAVQKIGLVLWHLGQTIGGIGQLSSGLATMAVGAVIAPAAPLVLSASKKVLGHDREFQEMYQKTPTTQIAIAGVVAGTALGALGFCNFAAGITAARAGLNGLKEDFGS